MTDTKTGSVIRRVELKCPKCGETDHIKLWENEPVPIAVNCWNCHAGFNMEMAQMIQQKRGMFPTGVVETYNPALA